MKYHCAWEGCPNLTDKGLCRTHRWRRKHGKSMGAPIRPRGRSTRETVQAAARALAEADDLDRAWHRLRVAAARYFKANGWTPPPKAHT